MSEQINIMSLIMMHPLMCPCQCRHRVLKVSATSPSGTRNRWFGANGPVPEETHTNPSGTGGSKVVPCCTVFRNECSRINFKENFHFRGICSVCHSM